nr:hypothetical protein [Tanacetum cinerariifolium]
MSSISNTPQISSVVPITLDLPTEEPEYSLRRSDGKFQNLFEPSYYDEEIISTKIDLHYFNTESNLLESLLNRDTLIDSSPKFDYLLEEFSGEL